MYIKSNSYYCEECGMELVGRGNLCPDCAREVRNMKFPPKKHGSESMGNTGKKPRKPKRDSGRKRGLLEDAD